MRPRQRLPLLLLMLLFRGCIAVNLFATENRDYCEADDFEPSCGDNSVVVMTTARYGRMRLGSCVREDLGYVGCKSNVLPHVDWRCSGKQSCTIRIPDSELDQTRPCPGELKTYLEASYICVQVESPTRPCVGNTDANQLATSAGSSWSINRSFGSGYLVSDGQSSDHSGRLVGCASERSPLHLSVRPGQRLNFTVFDFGYSRYHARASAAPPVLPETGSDCRHFLVLVEPQARRRVKICPSGWRMRGGSYISRNNTVQLYFKRMSTDDHRFLVQFSVVGCPEMTATDDMRLTRLGDGDVQLACRATEQKWRLTCVDNHWHGIVGNCTVPMPFGEIEDDLVGELSHGTAIAVVLCVALLMGLIVLIIGAVGLLARRCRRRRPVQSSVSADMMKSASGQHEFGVDEPLELRTAPVVDGSDYVTRVLCTGCGRDFDVLRGDKTAYVPVLSAHAHGTPEVDACRSFAGCRSLSLEQEPARRTKPSKKSFQAVPSSWGTDCGGTCSCPGTSLASDACVDSTAATCARSRPDNARTYDLWRNADETQLSLS